MRPTSSRDVVVVTKKGGAIVTVASDQLLTIPRGSRLIVDEVNGDWYRVQWNRKNGWISATDVLPSDQARASRTRPQVSLLLLLESLTATCVFLTCLTPQLVYEFEQGSGTAEISQNLVISLMNYLYLWLSFRTFCVAVASRADDLRWWSEYAVCVAAGILPATCWIGLWMDRITMESVSLVGGLVGGIGSLMSLTCFALPLALLYVAVILAIRRTGLWRLSRMLEAICWLGCANILVVFLHGLGGIFGFLVG